MLSQSHSGVSFQKVFDDVALSCLCDRNRLSVCKPGVFSGPLSSQEVRLRTGVVLIIFMVLVFFLCVGADCILEQV